MEVARYDAALAGLVVKHDPAGEGVVTNEVKNRVPDILRRQHWIGYAGRALLFITPVRKRTAYSLCRYPTRADAVYGNSHLFLQPAERCRHTNDSGLGRSVLGVVVRPEAYAGGGRDADNRSAAALADRFNAAISGEHYGAQEAVDDRQPALGCPVGEVRPTAVRAGVVGEDIEPTEALLGKDYHALDLIVSRSVRVNERPFAALRLDHIHGLATVLGVHVVNDDCGAGGSKLPRDSAPDAVAGTRDECDFTGYVHSRSCWGRRCEPSLLPSL